MYALIKDGQIVQCTNAESFFWKGLHLTGINLIPPSERKNLGIYDCYSRYQETPPGKKQCGTTQEIDHLEGAVYDVPVFIDKSPEELEREHNSQILSQIVAVEATITSRRFREAFLSDEGKAWLAAQDLEIESLRAQLIKDKTPKE